MFEEQEELIREKIEKYSTGDEVEWEFVEVFYEKDYIIFSGDNSFYYFSNSFNDRTAKHTNSSTNYYCFKHIFIYRMLNKIMQNE